MNILDTIIAKKREEVETARELSPVKRLEQSLFFESPCVSLRSYLGRSDLFGIIAEIKRRSPSKGALNQQISVEQLSIGYMQAGASALSILTDRTFFGGTNADLEIARRFNYCPILRKDFVIDPYQVVEAKSIGADVILLIARVLSREQIAMLTKEAHALGMEVLLEIHNAAELKEKFIPEIDVLGINNRDLDSFKTDWRLSINLAAEIPPEVVKISESGIDSAETLLELRKAGYSGFLIGEAFMKTSKPEAACRNLIADLQQLAVDN